MCNSGKYINCSLTMPCGYKHTNVQFSICAWIKSTVSPSRANRSSTCFKECFLCVKHQLLLVKYTHECKLEELVLRRERSLHAEMCSVCTGHNGSHVFGNSCFCCEALQMDHASLLKQFEHLDPHNQNTFEAKDLELLISTVRSSGHK